MIDVIKKVLSNKKLVNHQKELSLHDKFINHIPMTDEEIFEYSKNVLEKELLRQQTKRVKDNSAQYNQVYQVQYENFKKLDIEHSKHISYKIVSDINVSLLEGMAKYFDCIKGLQIY